MQKLYKFSVNTLVLFNYNCIDYYQSGVVNIKPFNIDMEFSEPVDYQIKCDSTKKKILSK